MSIRSTTHDGGRLAVDGRDVRDWKVRSVADDREVGRVDDLLVDDHGRVRYLDVALEGGRHVLVPSGHARAEDDREVVLLPGVSRAGLEGTPRYERGGDGLTPEREREHYRGYEKAYDESHMYSRPDYRGRGWGAGSAERKPTGELGRLDELKDYEVASHDPDPRGWPVVGADGREIGRVDHLIGDTGQMQVRYLTVTVDRSLSRGEERQVLIPIGHVDLDRDDHRVIVSALDAERVHDLPTYSGGRIEAEHDARLRDHFHGGYPRERRHEHPGYLPTGLYGTRSNTPSTGR